MGLFSILPESLHTLEIWLTRIFLFTALLVIGPWALLLLYDLALYICRSTTYELPWIGGRARGLQRPRAPSLTERPSGLRRRTFSVGIGIPGLAGGAGGGGVLRVPEKVREE
jgi:hypothetical protein